jgi:hypothetical protein
VLKIIIDIVVRLKYKLIHNGAVISYAAGNSTLLTAYDMMYA